MRWWRTTRRWASDSCTAHGEAAAQLGQADEDQAQAVLRVHVEVGEQPQVFEHVVSEMVGFVDDEHGQLLGFDGESGNLGSDGVVGGGAGALDGQSEFPGDGLVHVEHVAGGQRDVVHPIESGVELRGEVPADGGLAGTDLAGEHADALEFDEMREPGLGFAAGVGLEQFVGLGGGLEGQLGEGEVAHIHQSFSLSLRMASGEGGGSGAGSPTSICLVW